jgi:hypothetical protein
MTTTLLHADVQRIRFTQLALAAVFGLIPAAIRRPFSTRPDVSDDVSSEAQRVRELAATYAKTDPGFASDLYAAAARHEGLRAE